LTMMRVDIFHPCRCAYYRINPKAISPVPSCSLIGSVSLLRRQAGFNDLYVFAVSSIRKDRIVDARSHGRSCFGRSC
jgi:hypothetical protein